MAGGREWMAVFFFPVKKKKVPVKTNFFGFLDFFTGGKCFSRTLFSVFFTHTFFFHGHNFCIFSRVEYFVSRGVFFFLHRLVFFLRALVLLSILIKIVTSINTWSYPTRNTDIFC